MCVRFACLRARMGAHHPSLRACIVCRYTAVVRAVSQEFPRFFPLPAFFKGQPYFNQIQVIPFTDKIPKLCHILVRHGDNHELSSYQMSLCKCMRKRFACFLKSKSICPLLLFRRGLLISSCFRCDLISRILNVSSCAEAGRVVRVC